MNNIMARLESDMSKQFNGIESVARPYSVEDLESIAKAKADVKRGLEPQEKNNPVYMEEFFLEKSCQIIKGAK